MKIRQRIADGNNQGLFKQVEGRCNDMFKAVGGGCQ